METIEVTGAQNANKAKWQPFQGEEILMCCRAYEWSSRMHQGCRRPWEFSRFFSGTPRFGRQRKWSCPWGTSRQEGLNTFF